MRTTLLLATVLASLCASAGPAFAGQIVYSTEPADGEAQIRVMNDDGSNDRLLVHEDDIPGAESVYKPYVSPDGDTVVFQARTPSPGGYGVYCGFRCSGIYAYRDGVVTRVSQAPTDCPPGDLCVGLDTDPRVTGDGSHLFYQLIYGEPGGAYGTPQTISRNYYRTMEPGGGDEVEVPETSCGKGSAATPNPAVEGQFATSAYCLNGNYALKVLDVGGGAGSEATLGYDDAEFSEPAFRGDGELLVGAEDGGDPGIWLYRRDASGASRLVALAWDSDSRPFNSSPTFVGKDAVAFVHGGSIRTASTSCDSCSLDSTAVLASPPGVDAIAWTSRSIPDRVVDTGSEPSDGGGSNPVATPRPTTPPAGNPTPPQNTPAPLVLKTPARAKLATALRGGIKVPFVATQTGRLTMRATIPGTLAKKLGLVHRRTKKPVVVANGTTTVTRAGEAIVKLKFTPAAKKRLRRARSVALNLTGTLGGTTTTTRLTLTR
ncbi:MAG TPA: hypothetical protein VF529_02800 [Solirubrobacteraceae bacterium]|jgi:hypothetical protein